MELLRKREKWQKMVKLLAYDRPKWSLPPTVECQLVASKYHIMGNVISIFRGKPGALSGHEALRAKYRFSKVAGKGVTEITPQQFKALVGSSGQPCADALFNYVDSDHSGSLTYKEISHEIKTYRSMTTAEAKLRVLFSFYDQDHDGKISLVELAAAMKVASQALSESQLNQLASATIEEFDVDKDGFLNFVEFSALIQKSGLELDA